MSNPTPKETAVNPPQQRPSLLRSLAYLFLIIFFMFGSVASYLVIKGVQATGTVATTVGDLVRQIVLPVTPVILPSSTTIVHQITDLSRLETASFEIEKVITAETNPDFLWGAFGESIIFMGYGKVIAGVDFSQMQLTDLQVVDPDTVMVHLPPAKIFDDLPVLDNQKSTVLNRDTGLLASVDPNLETSVRQEAERQIREAATQTDILDKANANAEAFMRQFLQGLGFENVIFMETTPPTPPPFVQEVPKGFALTPVPTP